ncbi:MAG: hypothetical protein ABI693_10810 [Bryobacteraceae bacterium]
MGFAKFPDYRKQTGERARAGGAVRRVLTVTDPVTVLVSGDVVAGMPVAVAAVQVVVAETSPYEPFQKCVQTGYVPDNFLKPWICEITAFQGRRNTGGPWTRPDVTLIAIQTFAYVPNKLFEVITFEIKPNLETAMEGVYECAAHSAFAHRSYLALPDSDEYEDNPLYDRIAVECERFGLGLIVFEKVENWDTYTFHVTAKRNNPDPRAVNDFIKGQISEKSREEIQCWR